MVQSKNNSCAESHVDVFEKMMFNWRSANQVNVRCYLELFDHFILICSLWRAMSTDMVNNTTFLNVFLYVTNLKINGKYFFFWEIVTAVVFI